MTRSLARSRGSGPRAPSRGRGAGPGEAHGPHPAVHPPPAGPTRVGCLREVWETEVRSKERKRLPETPGEEVCQRQSRNKARGHRKYFCTAPKNVSFPPSWEEGPARPGTSRRSRATPPWCARCWRRRPAPRRPRPGARRRCTSSRELPREGERVAQRHQFIASGCESLLQDTFRHA